jgi:hypothetical protein
MRHVDEAILNAYLDGELDEQGAGSGKRGAETVGEIETHLATCRECRALFEEVKRVRDRASEILSASTPVDIEIPPFEEIRARSEARSTSSRVLQMSRIKKLAWAATVVLAVAVGWYARGTVVPGSSEQMTAPQRMMAASEPEEQAGSGERRAESELQEAAATVVAAELDLADEPADRGAGGRNAAVETAAPSEAPPAVAGVPSRGKTEAEAEAKAAAEDQVARRQRRAVDTVERALAQAPQVVAQQVAAEPSAPVGGIAVGEVLLLEDSLWVDASEADARNMLGGDVPTVAGLPVIDYSVSLMGGRNVVRVRQRLDDEKVLELVVSRAVSPERARLARRDDAVTVVIGEYQVVLRGGVSNDSLQALGRKVR